MNLKKFSNLIVQKISTIYLVFEKLVFKDQCVTKRLALTASRATKHSLFEVRIHIRDHLKNIDVMKPWKLSLLIVSLAVNVAWPWRKLSNTIVLFVSAAVAHLFEDLGN